MVIHCCIGDQTRFSHQDVGLSFKKKNVSHLRGSRDNAPGGGQGATPPAAEELLLNGMQKLPPDERKLHKNEDNSIY